MSLVRADRPGPWVAALLGQVLAVLLVLLVSPNRYAWMLDDPGQTLPVDEASQFKAVLLPCTSQCPALTLAWACGTERTQASARPAVMAFFMVVPWLW